MKKLNRMLLINWSSFVHEKFDFGNITFLSGANGSGKSTIIDAMQLILLGRGNGNFFNKAANQKSDRNLRNYLFGLKGDNGNSDFQYIRNGKFNCYIALEFLDTKTNLPLTLGFMATCHTDKTFDEQWFIMPGLGIPEDDFIEDGIPYNLSKLKSRYSDKKIIYPPSAAKYREESDVRLGSLGERYRELLRKSVPFTPIANITTFITNSICEVKNTVDISEMQNDIRAYMELEAEAREMSEKLYLLEDIGKEHAVCFDFENKLKRNSYILECASLDNLKNSKALIQERIDKLNSEISVIGTQIAELDNSISLKKPELENLKRDYYQGDLQKYKTNYENEIRERTKEINRIQSKASQTLDKLIALGDVWCALCNSVEDDINFSGIDPNRSNALFLKGLTFETLYAVEDSDVFSDFMRDKSALQNLIFLLDKTVSDMREKLIQAEDRVKSLQLGIRPYPESISSFRNRCNELLGYNPAVLSELVDLKIEDHRDKFEAFFGKYRFALFFPEDLFCKAKELCETEYSGKGVIIVNRDAWIGKEISSEIYRYFTYEDDAIGSFLSFIMSGVSLSDQISSAKLYGDVFLSGNDILLSYDSKAFKEPFLGRKSIELLLVKSIEEVNSINKNLDCVKKSFYRAQDILGKMDLDTTAIGLILQRVGEFQRIESLYDELEEIKDKYNKLDLTSLYELEDKMRRLERAIEVLQSEKNDKDVSKRTYENEIQAKSEALVPLNNGISEKLEFIRNEYDSEFIADTGRPAYEGALKSCKSLQTLTEHYAEESSRYSRLLDEAKQKRNQLRVEYTRRYKVPYDSFNDSNDEFDGEKNSLKDIRLPSYLDKIQKAKDMAIRQFKQEFISKIKSNIDSIEGQIRALNFALQKSTFGTDSYRFVYKPAKEYEHFYNMFTDPLLLEGPSLMQGPFEEKYASEINQLFKMLVPFDNKDEDGKFDRAAYEKNVEVYTDYRTYLTFDLKITDKAGNVQSLSKTYGQKSGGETQLPFYIALLASFSQACMLTNRRESNAIRLIILDEAFSKMDGEKIKESIRLLKRFNLQALFSAPPDKIGDISPLCDKTLIAIRSEKDNHMYVKELDKKLEGIDIG